MDSYPPAASAASRAFDAAFSKTKQMEAVRYCRKEILFYLKDILLDQSPQTLSDPKATAKDEMDAKYERVVASSLSALKTLVDMIVVDERLAASAGTDTAGTAAAAPVATSAEKNTDAALAEKSSPPPAAKEASSSSSSSSKSDSLDAELEALLSHKKMVKLSVHSNPSVRAAWFSLVATVCCKRPHLFLGEGEDKDGDAKKKESAGGGKLTEPFASSVLNRFEETDPTVVAAFWGAVMAVLKVWTLVSITVP